MLAGPPTPYYPSPHLINQFCNFHPGVVKNLQDPERRGRVQVECPGLLGTGRSNWTNWVEMGGTSVGSSKDIGDEGDWWLPQVGQCVLIGFVAGVPDALWYIPGPPCSDEGNEQIPVEPKAYKDGRKSSRCRIRKSEAGHTLLFDDNGGEELCALLNWTGSGVVFWGQGKEKDESEKEDEESKPRKGVRRGIKNVFSDSSLKPSELLKHGIEYVGLLDLMRGGLLTFASDDIGGVVIIQAKKKDGSLGPSLVLDGVNDRVYLSTSKGVQIQLLGDKDKIMTTRHMILEAEFEEMKGRVEAIEKELANAFKKYEAV